MKPGTITSPARWALLSVLSVADRPLTRRELADLASVSVTNVRDALIRPVRARWVTTTLVPNPGRPGSTAFHEITSLGRRVLAGHCEESS